MGFLDSLATSFSPAFQRSGQNYLDRQLQEEQLRQQAESDAIRNQLIERQMAGLEQDQRFKSEDRERDQAKLLGDLAAEAGGLTKTMNLLDTLSASGQVSPEQKSAIETLPIQERGAALMELIGALKPPETVKPVVVGDALVDPHTGKPIFQAPQAPGETFTLVKGADVGLSGAEAEKLFNRSDKSGKLTAAGGGGVTVNTGDSGPKLPTNYMWKDPDDPNKGVIPIPGSSADPENLSEKPEGQLKSIGFAERAKAAEEALARLGAPSGGETGWSSAAEFLGDIAGSVSETAGSAVESAMRTETGQLRDQAQNDFVTAVLRKESGAVISDDEFTREGKKFFAQPGDSAETIAQKARARARAIGNLVRESGTKAEESTKPKRLKFNPGTGGFD